MTARSSAVTSLRPTPAIGRCSAGRSVSWTIWPRAINVPLRRQGPSQAPYGALNQTWVEIVPIRIHPFDFTKLPLPLPFLHLQLAVASILKIVMPLVPDENLAAIFLGKSRDDSVSVLTRALCQIARYTDVKRSVATARH